MLDRPARDAITERLEVRIRGLVQGVGFRPHVWRLATGMGLTGFVLNDADGVLVDVEGRNLATFLARLESVAPPRSRISSVQTRRLVPEGATCFVIRESGAGTVRTLIGPDGATCPDCRADMTNPASRFHGYAFTNCTHCGPRFTITRALPYDRAMTSMASFPPCAVCAADYADPANRRFHAEPVACPACGPVLSMEPAAMARAILAGQIVALKGIGGFHLMADARNEAAIATLRQRKDREAKPFAVMVADALQAGRYGEIGPVEHELLTSPAAPIVLCRDRGQLPAALNPGLGHLGLMLAYAPVHHLLMAELEVLAGEPVPLLATSANPGGEPLVADDAEARDRLDGIADVIVTHDRGIVVRADDSVLRVILGAPAAIRHGRGLVPVPVELAEDGPDVIACGADMKNAVLVTRGREAFLSQHVGTLDNAATIRFQREAARHLLSILDVRPEAVACDRHPDFRSTRFAESLGLPVFAVQHHHAHVLQAAADAGLTGPVLGLALDGHGLGADGTPWGGELIVASGADWSRTGSLLPLAMPGGDLAAREPWRMAAAALVSAGRRDVAADLFSGIAQAPMVLRHLAAGRAFPATSSLGRLFDAAAAIAGLSHVQAHEGQAAMRLEAACRQPVCPARSFALVDEGGLTRLDLRPLFALLADARPEAATVADWFHGTLIEGLAALVTPAARRLGLGDIVMAGGCALNAVLSEGLAGRLARDGLRLHLPRRVPVNDGGIALGQAVAARRLIMAGTDHREEMRDVSGNTG